MADTANAALDEKCPYCGGSHPAICPRIKSVEYSEMNPGMFQKVEFFSHAEMLVKPELRYGR